MWNSVDDMVRELGLPVAPDDFEAVEKALKKQLAMVHPDTTGGHFASDGQEARFHRISEGLEFLKQVTSGPPALRVTDIQKIVQAAVLAVRQDRPQAGHTRAEVLDTVLLDLRRANRLPRITSATLFAVSTAVFAFGSTIKEHPVFKTLLQYPALTWLLGVLWLVSGVCFVMLWLRERATEQDAQGTLRASAPGCFSNCVLARAAKSGKTIYSRRRN